MISVTQREIIKPLKSDSANTVEALKDKLLKPLACHVKDKVGYKKNTVY